MILYGDRITSEAGNESSEWDCVREKWQKMKKDAIKLRNLRNTQTGNCPIPGDTEENRILDTRVLQV